MSDLLKMYKALQDEELGQRIQGAAVKYAHYLSGIGDEGSNKAFALIVLDEPFRKWQDMHIEVAANTTIMEQIVRQHDGTFYSGNVKDSDIEYVVETTWQKIAAKYAPQPDEGNGE